MFNAGVSLRTTGADQHADDAEVLAYTCAYHEAEEGCGCAEGVLAELRRNA